MLRKVLKALILLSLALIAWITVFSFVDGPVVDDSDLAPELLPLADEENGYVELLALSENAELAERLSRVGPELSGPVDESECGVLEQDPGLAAKVRETFEKVGARSGFRQPRTDSFREEFPPYQYWVWGSRVLLQDAYCGMAKGESVTNGNLDSVLSLIQSLETDQRTYLVSYAIGLRLRNDLVWTVRAMAASSPTARRDLLRLLEEVPGLDAATSFRVLGGEYAFVKGIVLEELEGSITQRLSRLWRAYEECQEYTSAEWCAGDMPLRFLAAVFPSYYFHQNTTLAQVRDAYLDVASRVEAGCMGLFTTNISVPERSPVLNHLLPNGLGRYWLEVDIANTLPPYFGRSCLSAAWIEGVRTVIALELYFADHNQYPAELAALVPTYLSVLPLDPYSSEPFGYDAEKGWVYSVGENGVDDGGSLESVFHHRCFEDEVCYNNLTILLLGHELAAMEPL